MTRQFKILKMSWQKEKIDILKEIQAEMKTEMKNTRSQFEITIKASGAEWIKWKNVISRMG